MSQALPRVMIIDYGMGNLFSIQQACLSTGIEAWLSSSRDKLDEADAFILPGVGAFGDAMKALRALPFMDELCERVRAGQPLMGICLGLQLLFSESEEFGQHQGLDLIQGKVVALQAKLTKDEHRLKVPDVGWNAIEKPSYAEEMSFSKGMFEGIDEGSSMYFVHSFVVEPADPSLVKTTSYFGEQETCSSIEQGSIFACQFHPERSAQHGLTIYKNFAKRIQASKQGGSFG